MPFSPSGAFVQVNSASPTGRASTSGVMLGLGALITPTSGRIVVLCTGVVGNGTSGDGAVMQLAFGTGAAPANNAAITGTTFGGNQSITSFVTTELNTSFALSGSFVVTAQQYAGTGVAPTLTTYWIDIGFSSSAGTVTFTQVNLTAWEV